MGVRIAGGALLAPLLLMGAPVHPAAADEVVPRPSSGVFVMDGHGWGHGRGMSQWGSQGAASLGLSADTITSTYYPGTDRAALPDALIRVLLSADEGVDTEIVPSPGLVVTDLSNSSALTLPAGFSRFRARLDVNGMHVEGLTTPGWVPIAVGGALTSTGPYAFSGPPVVRVRFPDGAQRDYRASVRSVRSGSVLQSLAVMGMEDYLTGVVPQESPSSWLPAALQAQSIAARSYSAYKRAHVAAGATYDICDTTSCQVFGGSRVVSPSGVVTELEAASTTAAVRATSTVVRTYQGAPIFAEFSSSNGGFSTAGSVPYLPARADPWDGVVANGVHSWTGSVSVADLEARFPTVGHLDRLRVTGRDGNGEWGGRVLTVVLEGTAPGGGATSVATTGSGVYGAATWPARSDGLRSTWWKARAVPTDSTLRLVNAMYLDFLGRPADVGGLYFWAGRITDGTWTTRDVAFLLARSPEYTARLVTGLYSGILGRTPDPAGLAGWSAVLQGDPSQAAAVASALYASDELYAQTAGTDRAWVTELYRQVLLRGPDPAGLDGWTAQVSARGRIFVARSIYDSPESLARRVQALYTALLGRPADAVGLAGWPGVVVAQGDIALAADLASSEEYRVRAQGR